MILMMYKDIEIIKMFICDFTLLSGEGREKMKEDNLDWASLTVRWVEVERKDDDDDDQDS